MPATALRPMPTPEHIQAIERGLSTKADLQGLHKAVQADLKNGLIELEVAKALNYLIEICSKDTKPAGRTTASAGG